MPSNIVSVPVVNCSCSSSSRAAGRTLRASVDGAEQALSVELAAEVLVEAG